LSHDSRPQISIIIPCYNSAWSLPRLAGNLKQVARPGFDIVFVDDGSTDGSAELFGRLVPWARIVRQDNKGLSAARNAGVAEASGEYLQLLDADDTLEPLKIETQAEFAGCEGVDVVWSDWRMVIVDGQNFEHLPFQKAMPPAEMVEALLLDWWAPPVAYLFRREAYLDVGGCDESLRVWEDFDLFLRLAIAGKRHAYLPGPFANYHRYLQVRSLSRRNPHDNLTCRERIIRKAVKTLQEKNQLTPGQRKAAAHALHGVARGTFEYDRKWFRQLILDVYRLDPDFEPSGTFSYRAATRLLGFERAEKLAVWTRSWRGHYLNVRSAGV
jgi:glycosyltransferase involved in cell wall biosynthesis